MCCQNCNKAAGEDWPSPLVLSQLLTTKPRKSFDHLVVADDTVCIKVEDE